MFLCIKWRLRQEDLQTGSWQGSYWTDRGSCLHPHTSRWTYKRNFKQDHASTVTEQTDDLVFIHIHLVGPIRGTSNRIMSALILNRRRILSSSTLCNTSLDIQEELLTGSCQHSYWTDRDLLFSHIHLVWPTRGTWNRIMSALILNRRKILSSSTYTSLDLQEEMLTGSCQGRYWTDGGSGLQSHTSRWTYKRNLKQDHGSAVTEQTVGHVFIHIQGMDSQTTVQVLWILTLG